MIAVWTGLEPATSGVTGRHSNQLNYQTDITLRSFSVGGFVLHLSFEADFQGTQM